ncbi:hypothetical protein BDZ89DRAFT_1055402 [Hymenopellis radicata]|nr:hypothetical protein BDZ89DRAFT_1055402 [Hymenopellis radicata]
MLSLANGLLHAANTLDLDDVADGYTGATGGSGACRSAMEAELAAYLETEIPNVEEDVEFWQQIIIAILRLLALPLTLSPFSPHQSQASAYSLPASSPLMLSTLRMDEGCECLEECIRETLSKGEPPIRVINVLGPSPRIAQLGPPPGGGWASQLGCFLGWESNDSVPNPVVHTFIYNLFAKGTMSFGEGTSVLEVSDQ